MKILGRVLGVGIFALGFIVTTLAVLSDTSWSMSVSHIQQKVVELFDDILAGSTNDDPNAFWPATIARLDQKILGRPILFIGHAAGGYQKSTYTNSIDALEQNYREGLRFFEIDFMKTKDRKIVCIHDWRNGYLTYDEFKRKQYDQANFLMKFNNCDLDTLGAFLAARPDASLILDTKIDEEKEGREDAASLFKEITRHLTEKYQIAIGRIVPQAYSLDETKEYKASGYPNVIFTLYKVKPPKEFAQACKLDGVAITVHVSLIINGSVKVSAANAPNHCPIFVHPVEKLDQLAEAMKIAPQVRGIYTSFLRPE
jgi:glycerophosphoryl diester phosphodiesterase